MSASPSPSPLASPTLDHADFPEDGGRLVFVIGPFRGGTTLLRKMLDSHSALYSPAETWFLLPLLELWNGRGTAEGYAPSQAAAALRQHLAEPGFLDCCRAFAARFYGRSLPDPNQLYVDKTPLYLAIADVLPTLFPAARFIVLSREPRGLLWSRASWRHAGNHDPAAHVGGVALDIQRLANFLHIAGDRAHHVSYADLCRTPESALNHLTAFLDLPFEPSMLEYGRHGHHEGYGDEKSREHSRPHADSVERWRTEANLSDELQRDLFHRCGPAALRRLGYDGDGAATTVAVPAPRPTGGDGLIAFMHEGTNSRDHLVDFVRGFEQAGCRVRRVELRDIHEQLIHETDPAGFLVNTVAGLVREHGAAGTLAMWANGFAGFPTARIDGVARPVYDGVGIPHLAFWLDAPHWVYQGDFGSSLLGGTACRHLINNLGTGAEMAAILGFSNVIAEPYGINPETFRPAPDVDPEFDLVFCLGPGDPPPTERMRAALDSDDPDHDEIRRDVADDVRTRWRPALLRDAADLSDDVHDGICAVLEHLLQIQLEARHTPMAERLKTVIERDASLGAPLAALVNRPGLWVTLTATLRRVEQWERSFIFTWLARRFRCAVFSKPNLDAWDCPAERLGWVGHDQQSHAYARGRVALNVMRWQDDIGLNPKPMEIAASGVAALCQHRVGLDDLYSVGEEMLAFNTAAEAGAQLRGLLDDEPRRHAVAEAGLERTRRDHTWAKRAQRLMPMITSGV